MKTLLPAIVLIMFFACSGNKTPERGQMPNEPRLLGENLKYEVVHLAKKCEHCVSPNDCGQLSLTYPVVRSAPAEEIKQAINKEIMESLLDKEREEDSVGKLVSNFLEACTESEKSGEGLIYYDNRTVSLNEYYGIALLTAERNEYYGGLHPNYYLTYKNYDLKTGKRIKLEDLIAPQFRNKLTSMAENKLLQMGAERSEDFSKSDFIYPEGGFELNDNFAILPDTLRFYYNTYEIAPYPMGVFIIEFNWKEISHLVNPTGILSSKASLSKEDYAKALSEHDSIPGTIRAAGYSFVFEEINELTFNRQYQNRQEYVRDSASGIKMVRRKGDCMIVPLKTGRNLSFCDDDNTESDTYIKYSVTDYIPEADLLILHSEFIESFEYTAISLADGKQTELHSAPQLSPKRTRLLTASYDLGMALLPNGMQMFRFEDGKLVREFDFHLKDWGPREVYWTSDSTVIFKRFGPESNIENIGYIKMTIRQ